LPMVQLWITALLMPAGLVTPPKKDTRFSNAPNFISPQSWVVLIRSALNPSATWTLDQSGQLQFWSVSLAISCEDKERYSASIYYLPFGCTSPPSTWARANPAKYLAPSFTGGSSPRFTWGLHGSGLNIAMVVP